MAKFIATKDTFGFRDSLWKKGDIVEPQEGEKDPLPPFKLVNEGKPSPKASEKGKDKPSAE
jgi:hypothetical protein